MKHVQNSYLEEKWYINYENIFRKKQLVASEQNKRVGCD